MNLFEKRGYWVHVGFPGEACGNCLTIKPPVGVFGWTRHQAKSIAGSLFRNTPKGALYSVAVFSRDNVCVFMLWIGADETVKRKEDE